MTFNDLLKQYNLKEKKQGDRDDSVAKKVLMEYSEKYELLHPLTGNYMNDLLHNYFLLKNIDNVQILETIMNKYSFNYSMSIHNAIYYLLGKEEEISDLGVDPLLWPGIEKIEEDSAVYTLNTVLGEVRVSKASEIFKNTRSSYIFDKPLMRKCHIRSYDFIKENKKDYCVILSYMSNFFSGGHYHTYLESDSSVLDIASNSYYSLKEDSIQILNGLIIKKLDYNKIVRSYKILSNRMPELRGMDNSKLLTLSLYYDYKNRL